MAFELAAGNRRARVLIGLVLAVAAFAASWGVRAATSQGSCFVLGSLWGVYLLLSIVGWGALVNRLLVPGERLDWGQRAAWGMAALVVLGGLLNLFWLISPLTVFIVLATGLGALVWVGGVGEDRGEPISDRLRQLAADPLLLALVLVVASGVLLQLGGSLAGTIDTVYENPSFDLHDDHQAYLVFPEKMLQLGSMGAEPFEARRMLNLGGQAFLQTLVRAALPVRALHLVDMGVAFVILVGLVTGFARRHRLEPRLTVFALAVLLVVPHLAMRGNSSALLTGVVLLLSWYRLLADDLLDSLRPVAAGGLMALTAGGLVALKSTFIPAALTLMVVSYVSAMFSCEDRRRVVREMVTAVVLTAVFALPWMVSIFLSSGTLLYPVLGRGTYGGVFTNDFAAVTGDFGLPRLAVFRALLKHLTGLLPVLVLALFVRDSAPRRPALALALAAVVSVVMLVFMGDPEINRALTRYAFPITTAAILGLVLGGLHEGANGSRTTLIAVLAAGVFLILGYPEQLRRTYDHALVNLATAVRGEATVGDRDRRISTDLQSGAPEGDAFLATLRHPFLLDFGRNDVLVMSLPGMASLAPGLPVFEGAEAVAGYLLEHSIDHLAYGGYGDYGLLLDLSEKDIEGRYPRSKMRWVMLRYHQRYNQVVAELAATRKRVYESGGSVLLDLSRRVATVVPDQQPTRAEGFVDGVWTGGDAVIHDVLLPAPGGVVMLRTMGWHPLIGEPDLPAPRLFADEEELVLAGVLADGFLFKLERGPARSVDLRIVSEVLDPTAVGARPDGPLLGLDLRSVEIADREQTIGPAIRVTRQPLAGRVSPQAVWQRSGFFDDHNWSDGDATLDAISIDVPADHCSLVVSLYKAHPFANEHRRLGLRVHVNGVELELDHVDGLEHHFLLYDGLEQINRLRLLSSTFVPRELGRGNDSRTLGVPVKALETR